MKRLALLLLLTAPACTIYFDGPDHDEPGLPDAGYVEQIDAELGKVGVRALESREASITAYARKISMFEEVIGSKLDGLRGALNGLETKVAHAKLTAIAVAEDAA